MKEIKKLTVAEVKLRCVKCDKAIKPLSHADIPAESAAYNNAGLANGESVKWDTTANSGLGGWVRYTPVSAGGYVVNGGKRGPYLSGRQMLIV
jgi:hypothetical protein